MNTSIEEFLKQLGFCRVPSLPSCTYKLKVGKFRYIAVHFFQGCDLHPEVLLGRDDSVVSFGSMSFYQLEQLSKFLKKK